MTTSVLLYNIQKCNAPGTIPLLTFLTFSLCIYTYIACFLSVTHTNRAHLLIFLFFDHETTNYEVINNNN